MELNLRLVQTLLAVADEGSMTRAAGRLNLTQQAVSGQIRQLERTARATLLVRTSRGVALTPAGKVIAARGEDLLAAAEDMLAEIGSVEAGVRGSLRIAFKAQSTAHFIPDVLAALRAEAPGITVDLVSVSSLSEEVELLALGDADAAFLWLPAGDDRLTAARILREPAVVAVPTNHRLAGETAIGLAELAGEPVVGPHDSIPAEVRARWAVDPRPDGSEVHYGPSARTPEECLIQVASGRGVWLAPASTASYFTKPVLSWVEVSDAPPFDLALAWTKGQTTGLIERFLHACRRFATGSSGGPGSPSSGPT
ncbi:LysR family transcriptional regulator [Amycolatopsis sp. CA-230715]|uniref:LysR substrate-binding domain-containing protein n=1 Tax=Amycolatopsis sp. CA-230715 TaxID=2745196 RepID=UPI001C021D25|nr:LysR family transcriptional regulator [Amycolatopsis sp. CA-230715]QWF83134.1 Hca operon transcriptional activator HcaR [Amycolatopsis sp. CA-230715]